MSYFNRCGSHSTFIYAHCCSEPDYYYDLLFFSYLECIEVHAFKRKIKTHAIHSSNPINNNDKGKMS